MSNIVILPFGLKNKLSSLNKPRVLMVCQNMDAQISSLSPSSGACWKADSANKGVLNHVPVMCSAGSNAGSSGT